MDRRWPRHRILAQLSSIQQTTSLVIALCCDTQLASIVYQEAQRVNMLNGEWIWIALGETANHRATASQLPVGLLGLVSQPTKLSKHSMKGSLAILHSALQAVPVESIRVWEASFQFAKSADRTANWSANGRAQSFETSNLDRFFVAKRVYR